MSYGFLIITALKEVKKVWEIENGTGYIIGKVSTFNVTDNDLRSLCGINWLTDQVDIFCLYYYIIWLTVKWVTQIMIHFVMLWYILAFRNTVNKLLCARHFCEVWKSLIVMNNSHCMDKAWLQKLIDLLKPNDLRSIVK